jgi:hypothetical protein
MSDLHSTNSSQIFHFPFPIEAVSVNYNEQTLAATNADLVRSRRYHLSYLHHVLGRRSLPSNPSFTAKAFCKGTLIVDLQYLRPGAHIPTSMISAQGSINVEVGHEMVET